MRSSDADATVGQGRSSLRDVEHAAGAATGFVDDDVCAVVAPDPFAGRLARHEPDFLVRLRYTVTAAEDSNAPGTPVNAETRTGTSSRHFVNTGERRQTTKDLQAEREVSLLRT
jgi:hypothetical protein